MSYLYEERDVFLSVPVQELTPGHPFMAGRDHGALRCILRAGKLHREIIPEGQVPTIIAVAGKHHDFAIARDRYGLPVNLKTYVPVPPKTYQLADDYFKPASATPFLTARPEQAPRVFNQGLNFLIPLQIIGLAILLAFLLKKLMPRQQRRPGPALER